MSELEKSEKLIESLDNEIKLLQERISTEKEKNEILVELSDARKKEAEFYKESLESSKAIIEIKDEQIENNEKAIELLKKRKTSIIEKSKFFGLGVLVGIGVKSLF